jgi:hypothetical protein
MEIPVGVHMSLKSRSEGEESFPPEVYPSTLPRRVAPHLGRQQHLCATCASGVCSLDHIKAFVKDATFICKTCGRTAVHEANLCDPVSL